MKKLIAIICVLATMFITGCKTMPTPAEIETASYAIGISTARVSNMSKISDRDRQIVIDIVGEIKYCCPTAGQTIVEAWSSIAKSYVDSLVKKGEITVVEGQLILKTFDVIATAGDYMIRIRWPKIGEYTDLVLAATNGFCDGFLTAFKPVNTNMFSSLNARYSRKYDVDAYNYLLSTRK